MKCCAWFLLVNVCNCVKSLFDIYCQSEDMTNFDILQGKLEPPPKKGNRRSRKKLSSNERAWKMQKNEPSPTSMRQMVLEIFHFKVRSLGKMDIAILQVSASFSNKYDVTDEILQDNDKMKVQYLRSSLFQLFETLQAIRTWQRNFASFQICRYGRQNKKLLSIIEKQKVYCLSKSDVRKVIWNDIVWLLLQAVSSFVKKWVLHSSYCEKTIVFPFWIKANYSRLSCHSNEI